jgi:hypothetical protein
LPNWQICLIQILRVFLLGLFLIYAVLGAQFKSFTQPLLILLSVPMAFAGVILYLVLSGTPFSTTVLYAGVALAGIAVNDSIVLIDFVNVARKEGKAVADAVVEAAAVRLRPIFLTSVTTIGGLLPTAIGLGGYSVVWSPMASTIIFGLVFSTLTAVTVVPACMAFCTTARAVLATRSLQHEMHRCIDNDSPDLARFSPEAANLPSCWQPPSVAGPVLRSGPDCNRSCGRHRCAGELLDPGGHCCQKPLRPIRRCAVPVPWPALRLPSTSWSWTGPVPS